MSRKGSLTIKSSLSRIRATKGDVAALTWNADRSTPTDVEVIPFMVQVSGISVLEKRTAEAIKSIGLTPLVTGVIDGVDVNAAYMDSVNPLESRLARMAQLLIDLYSTVKTILIELHDEGFTDSQALREAEKRFLILYKQNLSILELIEPGVLALSFIQKEIQDEASAKELMSYLTYQ